jgi:hypothetical protein
MRILRKLAGLFLVISRHCIISTRYLTSTKTYTTVNSFNLSRRFKYDVDMALLTFRKNLLRSSSL